MPPEPKEIEACIALLESLVRDRRELAVVDQPTRNRLLAAAGRLSRPQRNEQRALARTLRKDKRNRLRREDTAVMEATQIRRLRAGALYPTPSLEAAAHASAPTPLGPKLHKERACYICKQPFAQVHFFYDQMCAACGDFNHAKRTQRCDLWGRTVYISGARLKIGYQAAIMLLRAGARVLVSTRFPRDAAARYAAESDYAAWGGRLQIYGLDLRHTPSVEAFAEHIVATEDRLDFVIHNACQTVRRPPGFFQHLLAAENDEALLAAEARPLLQSHNRMRADTDAVATRAASPHTLERILSQHDAPAMSQIALAPEDHDGGLHLFPQGRLDADLQQVDLRGINSWRLALDEVGTVELLEVQLVNAIAPFVLNARLKRLMNKTDDRDKHIVNVSAMEGQFYRTFKTDKHPHTNMAKAALNMMTRTSAADYVQSGIHMNAVDTGWITDEDPAHIAERKSVEQGFSPPLDIVDGAARIVDPIFSGIRTGEHVWGQFLKDYKPTPW